MNDNMIYLHLLFKNFCTFLSGLGIIFIILKLVGVITWSWWWVTVPFWGGIILSICWAIIIMIYGGTRRNHHRGGAEKPVAAPKESTPAEMSDGLIEVLCKLFNDIAMVAYPLRTLKEDSHLRLKAFVLFALINGYKFWHGSPPSAKGYLSKISWDVIKEYENVYGVLNKRSESLDKMVLFTTIMEMATKLDYDQVLTKINSGIPLGRVLSEKHTWESACQSFKAEVIFTPLTSEERDEMVWGDDDYRVKEDDFLAKFSAIMVNVLMAYAPKDMLATLEDMKLFELSKLLPPTYTS